MRKTIAGLMVASLIAGAFVLPASADSVNDAAVSGYVSMTAQAGSVELVSENKTPVIHIDDSDYEGVIRAANDLVNDIETVTGKTPAVSSDDITEPIVGGTGITMTDNGMNVILDAPLSDPAECYVAVYNSDKTLAGVKMSTGKIGDEVITGFTFDEKLTKPAGGEIKAFIWQDMKPVSGVLGQTAASRADLSSVDVVIGTLGESETVDALAASGKLNVSEIEGKWESFTIQSIDGTIVIAGSDKRGTIYGIYDLSEKIGVSPWYFWADTVIGHADALYINLPAEGYTEGEPSVKYRGIFLNDEYNLTQWSTSMGSGNMNNETYEKIFELLLRLKANYLWPAMHKYSTAFNVTDGNAALADKYGIVMGSSHCEPILRNNLGELYNYQQEWLAEHPDKTLYINTDDESGHNVSWMWTDKDGSGNTVYNKEFLTDYWRARAKANGAYENTYTLGMRGVHDGQFGTNMNSLTAMNEIIEAQTKILEEEVAKDGKDISEVPQVFIPYKEMLNLYNQGVKVPDYVTLMWPDDNFGYIRQLPTETEAQRSGGAGIYYHLSYHGQPTSYLWLGTTQPGLIREEMTKAYDMDAKEIWVANVGDLKPAETEIEYFLDLAKDVDAVRNEDIADRLAANAMRDFGFDEDTAAEYADIKLEYYELANSRRPEHMVQGLYSLTDFGDEGQMLLDRYQDIENRAQMLYDELPSAKQPSLYELLLYPIKGAHSMAEKYVYADKAKYYVDNGYGAAANKYAALSNAANTQIDKDTKVYTDMFGGKWDKMMNPRQTGVRGSYGGPISGEINPPTVATVPYTTMTIVPDGGSDLSFHEMNMRAKFVDIINSGSGSFNWKATVDVDWIVLNKASGTIADNDRIYVGIDESNKPTADSEGNITFECLVGSTVVDTYTIPVNFAVADAITETDAYYYETDGYVSIETEHYTNNVPNGVYEWKVEKDLGRSGDSVKIYPNRAAAVSTPNAANSAYLEYKVYFESSGTFPIDVYRMPTVNELSGATLRCRIGVDNGTPVQFNGNTSTTSGSNGTDAWGKGVLQNTQIISGSINVPSAGMHTIRLYNESPGVVIDKFVITTGTQKSSYYGAPESYNSKYNVITADLPAASTPSTEQTGNVTALFSPSMLITNADAANRSVDVIKLSDVNTGKLIAAVYDANGNMIDMSEPVDVDLSGAEINEAVTVSYSLTTQLGNTGTIQYMIVLDTDLDSEASFEALAPSVEINLSDIALMASYDNGYVYPATRMNNYYGKESVCVIADTNGEIKYIRQNTVEEKTYEKIPFSGNGKYNLKIKIAGESGIISETFNTIINIRTDTNPTSTPLYNWDFSTNQTGTGKNVPVLGGPAVYDENNKCIRLTPDSAQSGGNVTVTFDALTAAQGEAIVIKTDIAYGHLGNRFTDYVIKDSVGKELVSSHINAYATNAQSIKVGGVEQLDGSSARPGMPTLGTPGGYNAGAFVTYTTTIDITANTITLTTHSSDGDREYVGKLPDGTSYDVASLTVSTTHDNASRTSYVDNISVSKTKAAAYTMTFKPVDETSEADIANAKVTVTDGLSGAAMAPEADGTFKLCDGIYYYTVESASHETVDGTLELSPATESKEIIVKMTAGAERHTVTFDSNGGSDVTPQFIADGGTAARPADPTKIGCAFDGWYLDGDIEQYDFDTPVTGDITLKAHWIEKKYTVTITPPDPTEGMLDVSPDDEVQQGSSISIKAKAAEGYDLVSINIEPDGGSAIAADDVLYTVDKDGYACYTIDNVTDDYTTSATFRKDNDWVIGSVDESDNKVYSWTFGGIAAGDISSSTPDSARKFRDNNAAKADYANLTVSLGNGDSMANGKIEFSNTCIGDGAGDTVNSTKRYLIVKPNVDGKLSMTVSTTSTSTNRMCFYDFDNGSVDLSKCIKFVQANNPENIFGGTTFKNTTGTTVTGSLTAGHTYVIYLYSYNKASTVSNISFTAAD